MICTQLMWPICLLKYHILNIKVNKCFTVNICRVYHYNNVFVANRNECRMLHFSDPPYGDIIFKGMVILLARYLCHVSIILQKTVSPNASLHFFKLYLFMNSQTVLKSSPSSICNACYDYKISNDLSDVGNNYIYLLNSTNTFMNSYAQIWPHPTI